MTKEHQRLATCPGDRIALAMLGAGYAYYMPTTDPASWVWRLENAEVRIDHKRRLVRVGEHEVTGFRGRGWPERMVAEAKRLTGGPGRQGWTDPL